MTRLSLPLQSYNRATPASTSRLVNCFVEPLPNDANAGYVLTRTPGVSSWTTVGTGPIQAMHAAPGQGLLYVVSAGTLYKVTTGKVATSLGSVGSSSTLDIDSNSDSVVVVNNPLAYYYNGTTFGQITDADFTAIGAGDVEFLDDYLLFREPNSGVFFGSALGSATSYDALDFATAEASPDDLVGMKVDHRQVLLFGERTLEMWENTGIAGFPFERMVNGIAELGCLAGQSIAKIDNSVLWLANDYTVRRLEGATPVRVSTHAVERWIKAAASPSAMRAFTHSLNGHLLYELTADEGTFCFDVTTGLWHEKQTYGTNNWRWRWAQEFAGQILVGDSTSNAIGVLDDQAYSDLGSTLRMEWTYQPVYAEGRRAFHDRLEIVCETGVGLAGSSDPEIMLDKSDDGGKTWTSLPNKTLGAVGAYLSRAVWTALGSSRERVYRAAVSDPVKVTITETNLDVRGGRL